MIEVILKLLKHIRDRLSNITIFLQLLHNSQSSIYKWLLSLDDAPCIAITTKNPHHHCQPRPPNFVMSGRCASVRARSTITNTLSTMYRRHSAPSQTQSRSRGHCGCAASTRLRPARRPSTSFYTILTDRAMP